MGKKRIVAQTGTVAVAPKAVAVAPSSKKKFTHGVLHIQSTYNNTKLTLTDGEGRALGWSSSGALGFRGAKKGTTFAAGKVGELMADKALGLGIKEVEVVIKGVGSGRESAMRAFAGKGISLAAIKDATPIPFNGPKPKKPRRV